MNRVHHHRIISDRNINTHGFLNGATLTVFVVYIANSGNPILDRIELRSPEELIPNKRKMLLRVDHERVCPIMEGVCVGDVSEEFWLLVEDEIRED